MTSTRSPARHLVLSRRGGLLSAATLLLGAATSAVVAHSAAGFHDVLVPVQLALSVPVPFFGVLAVTDLHQPRLSTDPRLAPRLRDALGLAVGFALAGTLLAAMATAWADGSWPPARQVAALVAGAVLVQAIAQLTGTGWGLLLRRPVLAMAATIVVPMTTVALLGAIDPHGGPTRWLTPYGNAGSLLAGTPTASGLAGLCVVTLLWCALPNAVGARRINPTTNSPEF